MSCSGQTPARWHCKPDGKLRHSATKRLQWGTAVKLMAEPKARTRNKFHLSWVLVENPIFFALVPTRVDTAFLQGTWSRPWLKTKMKGNHPKPNKAKTSLMDLKHWMTQIGLPCSHKHCGLEHQIRAASLCAAAFVAIRAFLELSSVTDKSEHFSVSPAMYWMQLLIRRSRWWLMDLMKGNKIYIFNDTSSAGWISQPESKLSGLWLVLSKRVYHTQHSRTLLIAWGLEVLLK